MICNSLSIRSSSISVRYHSREETIHICTTLRGRGTTTNHWSLITGGGVGAAKRLRRQLAKLAFVIRRELAHVPITPFGGNLGDLTAVVNEARRTGDFSEVPADINPDIHRRLVVEAREYYASLLREIADPANRPLVFHCSHGIHRTGTAAAILLSALGVPWETVREDYLLSNTYRQEEIEHRLAQLRDLHAENTGVASEEVDTTNMDAFYILQGAYIDAALEQAVEDYGSMEAYIRDGLGITDEEVDRLRSQLLE